MINMRYLFILVIAIRVGCVDFFINRTLTCKRLDSNGQCGEWVSNGSISSPGPKCFPGHTLILTDKGAKTMDKLQVGERVLTYNEESQHNQYTEVLAWLHRITNKKFEYLRVEAEGGVSFYSSSKHNIAVRDRSRGIDYVFGTDLLNRTLVSANPNQDINVERLVNDVALGVYSPYTQLGNYYILADNMARPLRKQENTLILVHSFAEINNPRYYDIAFGAAVRLSGLLGYNVQPVEDSYVHPLSSSFSRLFPSLTVTGDMVHQDTNLINFIFDLRADNERRNRRRYIGVITTLKMMMECPAALFR